MNKGKIVLNYYHIESAGVKISEIPFILEQHGFKIIKPKNDIIRRICCFECESYMFSKNNETVSETENIVLHSKIVKLISGSGSLSDTISSTDTALVTSTVASTHTARLLFPPPQNITLNPPVSTNKNSKLSNKIDSKPDNKMTYQNKVYNKKIHTQKTPFYDRLITWAEKRDPADIHKWQNFVNMILTSWGWNRTATSDFRLWGIDGFNYKALQLQEPTIKEFYDEVIYCSDRMSLDRLFRCHVLYRNITHMYST